MKVVALTGGIGCGKSAAVAQFEALDVPIVDTDVISHQLTAPGQPLLTEIARTFGKHLIANDGTLNRAALRSLVFSNALARQQLNTLLHPAIYQVAAQQLKTYAHLPYTVLVIPLLDKNTIYLEKIDFILLIDCDETLQINRVMQRSHLNEAEIRAIIQAQPSHETRIKMANAVIKNDGNVAELHEKIQQFHQKYIKTCIVSKTIS